MQSLHPMYIFSLIGGVCDKMRGLLIILTIYIFILRFLSSNLVSKYNNRFYNLVIITILILLIMIFFTSSFLHLYIFFEFSILPIFLLIQKK
jgi:NADH:ubiquinone oxidoreductase subunit 4 (subunit M)